MDRFDVVVIGAGAAGMMCAGQAARRGRRTLVIDHASAPGEKIRISGGGRCNFTNLRTAPGAFLSQNPRFCISPLRRYRPEDFVALLDQRGIAWHERSLGQLFCEGSAQQVVDLLVKDLQDAGAELRLGVASGAIASTAEGFQLALNGRPVCCQSLVVATGGKSIPKMGASGFGYEVARTFGVNVIEPRPALVPLTFEIGLLDRLKSLIGVSVQAEVSCADGAFEEAMLFTHRGVSGPAILQISSYWREGQVLQIDMVPTVNLFEALRQARTENGRQALQTALSAHMPKRLAQLITDREKVGGNLADASDQTLRTVAAAANAWRVKPVGSEGYRTAEVTLGGVDTAALDQRTFMVKGVPGLHFIGEVVDVTGWLGGYNFQWAWASGWCAGQSV